MNDDDNVLDPRHNRDLPIEIFDSKKKTQTKKSEEISLADMFLAKKKDVIQKLIQRKQEHE